MDSELRRARGTSFGSVAEVYERSRPLYPEDAVRWLVGDTPADVLDLGAGTGKLTRQLVALGHRVVAVDPLPEMLAQLRAVVPGVEALEGMGESIPLAADSVGVVTIAQAFHWLDPVAALPEIARVLRPGGVLALVWNMRQENDLLSGALEGMIDSGTVESGDAVRPIDASGLFGAVETASFGSAQRVDRGMLLDLVLSRSYCASMAPDERDEVLEGVGALYDAAAGSDGVELSYKAECFRAARR